MTQYERGHSDQEIEEMQQRLIDFGNEVIVTTSSNEQTLAQLGHHHANRGGGGQYAEEPVYEAGAGAGNSVRGARGCWSTRIQSP